MKLDLTDMLYALSFALDRVEAEILGVDTGHGKRVAYLALLMGKEAGYCDEELRDFIGCCLLHDNALVEFIFEELSNSPMSERLSIDLSKIAKEKGNKMNHDHSVIGEQNISLLPFRTDVKDIILYHHENANGSGIHGKKASEIPFKAEILHLSDVVDVVCRPRLETMKIEEYEKICERVQKGKGSLFSEEVVELFLKSVTYDKIVYLQNSSLLDCIHEELREEVVEYSNEEVRNIAKFFAKIVDYKSEFTQNHSMCVAEKAEIMAKYYGFDEDKVVRFYFAGALHDIGKLTIGNKILEKPGKLTTDEFDEMKNHADATRYILSQIKGLSGIVNWAANHHEKLNGKGYPRGLSAAELSFEDQLMACIDIYQALTEKRPYKEGLSHEKTMSILFDMVSKGELNEKIIRDMDIVMGGGN